MTDELFTLTPAADVQIGQQLVDAAGLLFEVTHVERGARQITFTLRTVMQCGLTTRTAPSALVRVFREAA
jgi:uncharacterized protein YqiB (DUF1249 family)